MDNSEIIQGGMVAAVILVIALALPGRQRAFLASLCAGYIGIALIGMFLFRFGTLGFFTLAGLWSGMWVIGAAIQGPAPKRARKSLSVLRMSRKIEAYNERAKIIRDVPTTYEETW